LPSYDFANCDDDEHDGVDFVALDGPTLFLSMTALRTHSEVPTSLRFPFDALICGCQGLPEFQTLFSTNRTPS